MSVRPLRPDTRPRHGGPLPRRPADGPQTVPGAEPKLLSRCLPSVNSDLSGITLYFYRLSRASGYVIHVLLTSPPLSALLPAARLAWLRRAASVRSEPGSNSPSLCSRIAPGLIPFVCPRLLSLNSGDFCVSACVLLSFLPFACQTAYPRFERVANNLLLFSLPCQVLHPKTLQTFVRVFFLSFRPPTGRLFPIRQTAHVHCTAQPQAQRGSAAADIHNGSRVL